jgi:DNA-binding NarL/FixJ family response regulator
MPIKVAIVEDDEYIRASLAELIQETPSLELAGTYADGQEAIREMPKRPPNVALMDIQMPGADGVECVRQLKPLLPDTSFLMLTVYEDSDWLFESLKAGASGYLLKRTSSARLLQAIREVHSGGSPMTPQIARRVVLFFSNPAERKSSDLEGLTPGQKDFLELLTNGYAYKEIADRLGITVDGVRSYVRRIYDKLHVHSRTEAVVKYLHRRPQPQRSSLG